VPRIPASPERYGNRLKTFKEAVRNRDFAVTARMTLRADTGAAAIREQANLLRNHVDAILVTDNLYGQVHMSTLAASALLVQAGVDPIMQLSCRNRNRIALLGDLLGAAALGVTSLLLVRGNKVPEEIVPRPKAVLDVKAAELIATAMTMKSDDRLSEFPDFFLGGAVTPHRPRAGWIPKKLVENIDAGAQFVQMPICMDMGLLRRFMKHLIGNKLIRRTSVIAAIAILPSVDAALWLRENRLNVRIPDSVITRLEKAGDAEQEGLRICTELLQELAEIPGISGATIMPGGNLAAIPAVIEAAHLDS
jgi:methylenetetrahydrofolate reductase (NADPH)